MTEEREQALLCPNIKRECETYDKYEEDQHHSRNIKQENAPNDEYIGDPDPLSFQNPIPINFGTLKKGVKREEDVKQERLSEDEEGAADLQHELECEDTDNITRNVDNTELSEKRILRSSGSHQKGSTSNSEKIKQIHSLGKRNSSKSSEFQNKHNRTKGILKSTGRNLYFANYHKKFSCDDCNKSYSKFGDLRDHITSVHLKIRNYKCMKCNKKYFWSSDLRKHTCSVQKSLKSYECRKCQKQFSNAGKLRRHSLVHKENKFKHDESDDKCLEFSSALKNCIQDAHLTIRKFECVICKNTFPSQSDLKKHSCQMEEKIKKYKCQVCDREFSHPANLKRHSATHRDKKYVCGDCNVRFCEFSNLKCHINSFHYRKQLGTTGKKLKSNKSNNNYACGICNMRYSTIYKIQTHISQVHSESGGYFCVKCNKIFSQLEDLKTHIWDVHEHLKWGICNNVYKFECEVCNKEFSNPGNLKQHRATHRERKYICDECGKGFFEISDIKKHINLVHCKKSSKTTSGNDLNPSYKIACGNCDMQYSSIFDAERHVKQMHLGSGDYKCVKCNKIFSQLEDLKTHIWEVHENLKWEKCNNVYKFECQVCNKQFSNSYNLKKHRAIHMERKFVCDDCKKAFVDFPDLKIHIETVHYKTSSEVSTIINSEDQNSSVTSRLRKLERKNYEENLLSATLNIENEDKIYACGNCDMKFFLMFALKQHIINSHSGIGSYKCSECNETFSQPYKLKTHVCPVSKNIKKYKCNVCNRQFSHPGNLKQHSAVHLPKEYRSTKKALKFYEQDKIYACGSCDMKFLLIFALEKHIRQVHLGLGICKCTQCNETFSQPSELKAHEIKIHRNSDKYKCQICDRKFPNPGVLAAHGIVHKERNYICADCDKRFVNFFNIKNHIEAVHCENISETSNDLNSHNPYRIYSCDSCDEKYSWINDLKNHIRVTHLGAGYYKCVACSETFPESDQLKSHTSSKHDYKELHLDEKRKKYVCMDCDKSYTNYFRLREHVRSSHLQLDVYKCNQCNTTYSSMLGLKRHYMSEGHKNFNKFECNICNKRYSHLCILKLHMVVHNRTKVVCEYCAKEFLTVSALKVHINLVHIKIRNFECQFCNKRFQLLHHLQNHITCVHEKVKNFICEHCGDRFLLEHHLRNHVNHIHKGIERPSRPVNHYSKLKSVFNSVEYQSNNVWSDFTGI